MKHTLLLLAILLFCNAFFVSAQSGRNTFYSNPVIAGDLPDPSIIRVGDTYYASSSSNDFAPVFPIFESKDLVNWKQVSAVFAEPPAWAAKDFWAPELYYLNGTFYVYYTAKRKDNGISCVGVATTKDIYQGFTDHGILIEWGNEAIDGFVFRDDDGKLYITWKAYGLTLRRDVELLCSEMSSDGLNLVGNPFSLTDRTKTWKGEAGEGQVLTKHNGFLLPVLFCRWLLYQQLQLPRSGGTLKKFARRLGTTSGTYSSERRYLALHWSRNFSNYAR